MRTGPPRVSQLAERRSAWLGDDLTAITLVASLIDQAERFLPELIASARLNGHTWNDIAPALATSPDDARLRFDPDSQPPTALLSRATKVGPLPVSPARLQILPADSARSSH